MKRYISSKTNLKQGSYVVDRNGKIYDIGMHVPSTTYLGRGLIHLATTDAQFLLDQNLITEDEAKSIMLYCYEEFLEDECGITDLDQVIGLTTMSRFSDYAEMRWAPDARALFFGMSNIRTLGEIEELRSELPDFDTLNKKWYPYLQDNYCKISRFGNVVEFRISSNDGFDWNKVIIDKVILKFDSGKPYTTRYNIARESDKGYQEYFYNATLEDILENDKVVLASKEYKDRKVVNNELRYIKRFIGASHKVFASPRLDDYVKVLPADTHTLIIHYSDGTVVAKFSIKDAVMHFGESKVSNAYLEGDGVVSIWIMK